MPSLGTIIKGTIGLLILLFIAGAIWFRSLTPCGMLENKLEADGADEETVQTWMTDRDHFRCARVLAARLLVGPEWD